VKIVQVAPPLRGGAGRLVVSLANAFSQDGHEVWLAFPSSTQSLMSDEAIIQTIRPNVQTIDVNLFTRENSSYWPNTLLLEKLIESVGPEIIHGHTGPICMAVALACRSLKAFSKTIATWHSWSLSRPSWMNDQDTLAFKQADVVITDSFYNARVLASIGIQHTKVIYPVVEGMVRNQVCERRVPDLNRQSYGPRVKVLICCVAEVSRRKNQGQLISLISELRSRNVDATLKIIGPIAEEEYAARLEAEYSELIAEGKVLFCGHVSEPWAVAKECDLFAFPSQSEGLGMAVVEAVACGIPTIFSDRQGLNDIREILSEDCFGVFNPDDLNDLIVNVERFLSLPPLLVEEKALRASEKIKTHFNFATMISEHLNVYKSSLGLMTLNQLG
jgi:glycosyltransferase involved in cell wall biosynthesis